MPLSKGGLMKKRSYLIVLLSLFSIGVVSTPIIIKANDARKNAKIEDKDIAYQTNFEGMTISASSTADINTGFVWVHNWENAKTVVRNNSNMLDAPLFDNTTYSPVGGFGIGSAGNLSRCKDGEPYVCQTYLEFTGAEKLFVEFVGDSWGSCILYPDGTIGDNPGGSNMTNVSYKDNILSFTFTKHRHQRDGVDGYIQFVGYNTLNAHVYFDDIVIRRANNMIDEKFDNFSVMDFTNETDLHHNLYLDEKTAGKYMEADGNKFARILYGPTDNTETRLFFINKLGTLNRNRKYDVSFDLKSNNMKEVSIYFGGSFVSEINNFKIDFATNEVKDLTGNKISNVKYENNKVSFSLDTSVEFNEYTQFEFKGISNTLEQAYLDIDNIYISQLPTIESIVADTSLVQKTYYVGDELNIENLEVVVNYTDDTNRPLNNNEFEISGFDSQTPGKQKITISYEGFKDYYVVSIIKKVTSISLDTANVKKTYEYGEDISFEGLVVRANFERLGEAEIQRNAFLDGYSIDLGLYDPYKPGTYTITVIYKNQKASYQVVVNQPSQIIFSVDYVETKGE